MHILRRLMLSQSSQLKLSQLAPTVLVLAILGVGWLAVHKLNLDPGKRDDVVVKEASAGNTSALLSMPAGKLRAGAFHFEPVESREIQRERIVTGRVRYDDAKHIDVRAPVDGLVAAMLVQVGDRVEKNQVVVVLTSPEIGRARAEVMKCRQELEIVSRELDRQVEINLALREFCQMLDQGIAVDKIAEDFAERSLGSFRQELLSAYTNLQLAQDLEQSVHPLAQTGSIAGKTLRERKASRQIAQAEFTTVRERAEFEVTQSTLKAKAAVADAERLLAIARQSLQNLVGYDEYEDMNAPEDSLQRLEIRAPFSGTIEARALAAHERVKRGLSLLILADTTSLFVAADVREGDWQGMTVEPGTQIRLEVPALGDATYVAELLYVGREVNTTNDAVPLVARIDNSDGALRPGMFARIHVPVGEPRMAVAVKPEAVVQHGNQRFVFMPAGDQSQFRRVNVETGYASEDWIELTSGVAPGQLVVDQGAFLLKSELLLEGEAE